MAQRGKGTKYARKYVKASQEEMRKTIIPQAADYCQDGASSKTCRLKDTALALEMQSTA